ncbi:MAG: hypothetical protein GY820_47640 [Gammaproteobacteria bacterium]|nr:hypothetical protein [Gammaproteobacteria bacterium]
MVSMILKYISPSGKVARVGLGASTTPTNAEVVKVREVQDSIRPWQVASNNRFLRIIERCSII